MMAMPIGPTSNIRRKRSSLDRSRSSVPPALLDLSLQGGVQQLELVGPQRDSRLQLRLHLPEGFLDVTLVLRHRVELLRDAAELLEATGAQLLRPAPPSQLVQGLLEDPRGLQDPPPEAHREDPQQSDHAGGQEGHEHEEPVLGLVHVVVRGRQQVLRAAA
jgi:hypothetical protein